MYKRGGSSTVKATASVYMGTEVIAASTNLGGMGLELRLMSLSDKAMQPSHYIKCSYPVSIEREIVSTL
jgi:hypothetical protein